MIKHILPAVQLFLLLGTAYSTTGQTTRDILKYTEFKSKLRPGTGTDRVDYYYTGGRFGHVPDKGMDFIGDVGNLLHTKADSAVFSNNSGVLTLGTKTFDAQRRVVGIKWYGGDGEVYRVESYSYHANGTVGSWESTTTDGYWDKMEYYDDGRNRSGGRKRVYGDDTIQYDLKYEYSSTGQLLQSYSIPVQLRISATNSYSVDSFVYTYSSLSDPQYSSKQEFQILYRSVNNGSATTLIRAYYPVYNAAWLIQEDSVVQPPTASVSHYKVLYSYAQDTVTAVTDMIRRSSNDLEYRWKTVSVKKAVNAMLEEWIYDYGYDMNNETYALRSGKGTLKDADDIFYYKFNMDWNRDNTELVTDTVTYERNGNKNVVKVEWKDYVMDVVYDSEEVGVNEVILEQQVSLYPNPAGHTLYIAVEDGVKDYDVVLYTASGQLVGHYHNALQINMQYQPAGQYLVLISDNATGAAITRKVVKQ